MKKTSRFLHTIKKAWSISACMSLLIGGPFLCIKAHAAAPTSVMQPPQVVAQTQQKIDPPTQLPVQKGVLNGENLCDQSGQGNQVLGEFRQDTVGVYQNQYFEYFWKALGMPTPFIRSHTHMMIHKPGTYDVTCIRVNPQVGWQQSN